MRTTAHLRLASLAAASATILACSPAVAAEKPEANTVQRVRPYLQPAVVHMNIVTTAIIFDSHVGEYIGEEGFVSSPRQALEIGVGGTCTGYAVSSTGHIASAGHCVDPNERFDKILKLGVGYAFERFSDYYDGQPTNVDVLIENQGYEVRHGPRGSAGADQSFDVYWDVATGNIEAGKAYPARVLDFMEFEKGDGALLKAEVEDNLAVPLSSAEIEVGKEIVAIGYPGSLEREETGFDPDLRPSYNDGKISGEATRGRLFKAYEHTAKSNGGMSGGPVADASGEVIGFNSFSVPDNTFISYARPVSIIRELMNDEGVENSLNDTSKDYKAGLDAFFAGEKDRAVDLLTTVSEADEDNAVAEEFLTKAEALDSPTNWFLVLVLPVIVLALVAAAAWMAVKRRRNASAEPGGVASFGSVDRVGSPPQPALAAATAGDSSGPSASPVGVGTEAPAARAGEPCPSCGDATEADEKFCSNCGTPLT